MSNYCEYCMRVKGLSKNVDSFVKLMQADYDEVPRHFWRIFSADVYDESESDGTKTVDICGDCAWSVYACMCEGDHTYSKDNSEASTSLREQSELLQLTIEVFSSEPGIGFQEHYLYKNGKELVKDCVDYSETYFENEDEFNACKNAGYYNGLNWSDADAEGYIKKGGIKGWGNFCI